MYLRKGNCTCSGCDCIGLITKLLVLAAVAVTPAENVAVYVLGIRIITIPEPPLVPAPDCDGPPPPPPVFEVPFDPVATAG